MSYARKSYSFNFRHKITEDAEGIRDYSLCTKTDTSCRVLDQLDTTRIKKHFFKNEQRSRDAAARANTSGVPRDK